LNVHQENGKMGNVSMYHDSKLFAFVGVALLMVCNQKWENGKCIIVSPQKTKTGF